MYGFFIAQIYLAAAIGPWGIVGIVLGVLAAVLAVLYFLGRRLQKKQAEAQVQIDAMKQYISMLIIDKKMLKPKDSGLPEAALSQLPWYAKNTKMPIVKAKIGPQIMTLMCDEKLFDLVPVKKECKAMLSGIYIMEIRGLRGPLQKDETPKKKGLLARLRGK